MASEREKPKPILVSSPWALRVGVVGYPFRSCDSPETAKALTEGLERPAKEGDSP